MCMTWVQGSALSCIMYDVILVITSSLNIQTPMTSSWLLLQAFNQGGLSSRPVPLPPEGDPDNQATAIEKGGGRQSRCSNTDWPWLDARPAQHRIVFYSIFQSSFVCNIILTIYVFKDLTKIVIRKSCFKLRKSVKNVSLIWPSKKRWTVSKSYHKEENCHVHALK